MDEYLKTDPFSLVHAVKRLRRAIHYEEVQRREGDHTICPSWTLCRIDRLVTSKTLRRRPRRQVRRIYLRRSLQSPRWHYSNQLRLQLDRLFRPPRPY